MDYKTPLNGTKTHPLTEHALIVLRMLGRGPVPSHEINPGVINRLEREALAERVMLPSPYKTHKGRDCEHLKITAAGHARIAMGGTIKL